METVYPCLQKSGGLPSPEWKILRNSHYYTALLEYLLAHIAPHQYILILDIHCKKFQVLLNVPKVKKKINDKK